MPSTVSVGTIDVIIAFLGLLITLGGIVYAFSRRWLTLASETYVDEEVGDELDSIEERLDEVADEMDSNQDRIDELQSLIEGGDSKFEKGLMDFLEENIERTNDIKDDLDEIRELVHEVKEQSDEID